MKKLILGSQSPRRQELLKKLGIDFDIMVCNKDEPSRELSEKPRDYVLRMSRFKGEHISKKLSSGAILITADTVVVRDDDILGKPKSREEALEVLTSLSDREHQVLTGFSIWDCDQLLGENVISTSVYFKKISQDEIESYLDLNTYQDKAGSYGIQNQAGDFVAKYEGSLDNVIGLPTQELRLEMMRIFGDDWKKLFQARQET